MAGEEKGVWDLGWEVPVTLESDNFYDPDTSVTLLWKLVERYWKKHNYIYCILQLSLSIFFSGVVGC